MVNEFILGWQYFWVIFNSSSVISVLGFSCAMTVVFVSCQFFEFILKKVIKTIFKYYRKYYGVRN